MGRGSFSGKRNVLTPNPRKNKTLVNQFYLQKAWQYLANILRNEHVSLLILRLVWRNGLTFTKRFVQVEGLLQRFSGSSQHRDNVDLFGADVVGLADWARVGGGRREPEELRQIEVFVWSEPVRDYCEAILQKSLLSQWRANQYS